MYAKYAGSMKGTVTALDKTRCGLLTSTDGYVFEFMDASPDVQPGSHVTFDVRFAPDWRHGIAKRVQIDPCPPKPPEYVITVQGCKNAG